MVRWEYVLSTCVSGPVDGRVTEELKSLASRSSVWDFLGGSVLKIYLPGRVCGFDPGQRELKAHIPHGQNNKV